MINGSQIKVYYHVFAGGSWFIPAREFVEALVETKLIEQVDEFNIGIVGPTKNRELVKKFFEEKELDFNVVAETNKGWEQETLDKLYEDALSSPPFKVLYAHTKGASNPSRIATAWRQDMTEAVVGYWETAVEILEDSDATGIYWVRAHKMFGGNFWWATSAHISKLGYPCRRDRWGAERWLRYVDGKDRLRDSKIRIVDLHPGFRLGSSKRQVFRDKQPKAYRNTVAGTGQPVTVKFLTKIARYKRGQVVTLPDGVFLRAVINGGKAAPVEPIDWTPEKADAAAREKNKSSS